MTNFDNSKSLALYNALQTAGIDVVGWELNYRIAGNFLADPTEIAKVLGCEAEELPVPSNKAVATASIRRNTPANAVVEADDNLSSDFAKVWGVYPYTEVEAGTERPKFEKPAARVAFIKAHVNAVGDKVDEVFLADGTIDGELGASIVTTYEERKGKMDAGSMRRVVKGAIEQLGGVTLMSGWFVPETYAAKVFELEQVFGGIEGVTLAIEPKLTAEHVAMAAEQSFEAKVKALTSKVEAFKSGTRDTTVQGTIDDGRELIEQMELYRDLTGLVIDDLTAGIDAVTARCCTILGIESEVTPQDVAEAA